VSLAHLEPRTELVPTSPVTLVDELELWKDCFELAKAIATTPFVPAPIRNNPAAVMATILRGHELGVTAMHSLQQIDFIDNRPALRAELMRALVQSKGHEIWTEEYTITTVTLCGRRAGTDHVQKVTWTADDVKRADLAGKANHRKYPRAMLLARATGELCRLAFADVLAGMSYTLEEVEDMDGQSFDDEPETPAPAKTTTRKATTARKKAQPRQLETPVARVGDQPPLPGEDGFDNVVSASASASEAEPDEVVIKRAQQIAIRARDADLDHHQVVAAVTNSLKSSAKELSAAEASQVLDAINAIQMGEAQLVDGDDGSPRIVAVEPAESSELGELDWSGEQWAEFLSEHLISKSLLLKEASRWCGEHAEKAPTTLDALKGRDELCSWLHSWALEQS
jgi:hypothetical protein